jgi:hypothetical protein
VQRQSPAAPRRRAGQRAGAPPPRRPVPQACVPEVARAFPRPLRASRGLARRERLEYRAAVRTCDGPAVRSRRPARARVFPRHPPPVRWSLGGLHVALKGVPVPGRDAH